jgi:hypothetical protein
MNSWLVNVTRTDVDLVVHPTGKVQHIRTELIYHGFSLIEHPDYPGNYRARFIGMHPRSSIVSWIVLRYTDWHTSFTELG